VKRLISLWSAAGDDLRLTLRRRVLDPLSHTVVLLREAATVSSKPG
jgi:hypothetical protein